MVTVMSTVPAACAARSLTVIEIGVVTVKQGAVGVVGHGVAVMLVPTFTLVALNPVPLKPVPLTVMVLVPAARPATGDTPVTVGTGAYVYWSAPDVVLIPPAVVTVMSTVPAACAARSMTLIEVGLVTVKHGAVGVVGHGVAVTLVPTFTLVALNPVPLKPVPVTVIPVPPAAGPAGGDTPATVGIGAYVYWSAPDGVLVPPMVVTVMSTVPAACAARSMTLIAVGLVTVKQGAVGVVGHGVVLMLVPTFTLVALNPVPLKPVPVTVIPVPPAAGPAGGDTPATVGIGAYVYWSAPDVVLAPPTVVTVMSTVPAACAARSMMLIAVGLLTVKHGAVGVVGHGVALMLVPTYTLVALNPVPLKPVPVTVIPVVPAAGPAEGDTPVTVGIGAYVY